MGRTILSSFVVDSTSGGRRVLPRHNPVYHINESCNCGTDINFPVQSRISPTADTYDRLEDDSEQSSFTKAGSYAYLDIKLRPTSTIIPEFGPNLSMNRTTGEVYYSPGPWGIKMTGDTIASGGFLSLHLHSTRNVFLVTKNTYITKIMYPSPGVGGPCGAWNGHHLTISKQPDYGNLTVCSDNCEILAQAMFADMVGSATNNEYVGCGIEANAPLMLLFEFNPPAFLEAGFTYSINCSTDPGAAVGYYGPVISNPPWGKFIKSQVGELKTINDWDYDWWGNLEYMNPNCTMGIAMDIYTTDTVSYTNEPINPIENAAFGYYTEDQTGQGVWVLNAGTT